MIENDTLLYLPQQSYFSPRKKSIRKEKEILFLEKMGLIAQPHLQLSLMSYSVHTGINDPVKSEQKLDNCVILVRQ